MVCCTVQLGLSNGEAREAEERGGSEHERVRRNVFDIWEDTGHESKGRLPRGSRTWSDKEACNVCDGWVLIKTTVRCTTHVQKPVWGGKQMVHLTICTGTKDGLPETPNV